MTKDAAPAERDPERVARARRHLPPLKAHQTLAHLHKVLCDTARCQIVRALETGPLSVEDLSQVIRRAPPATSQHLRILRELGLVTSRRVGNARYYTLRAGDLADQIAAVMRAVLHDAA